MWKTWKREKWVLLFTNYNEWLCAECVKDHNKTDYVIKSNGIEISKKCSYEGCMDEIEYYCKDCKLHFCSKCLKLHSTHTVEKLKNPLFYYYTTFSRFASFQTSIGEISMSPGHVRWPYST